MQLALAALSLLLATPGQKLAVTDIHAREGVTAGLTQIVTDAVVAATRHKARGMTVIASEDLRSLMGFEAQKRQLGCQDMACLAEIGGALGVDLILVGTLGKIGKSYILDLRIIDAKRAKVLVEADERLQGQEEDALLDAAKRAVTTLFLGLSGGVPVAEAAVGGAPSSHPSGTAIVLGSVGIAAGALAVVGLVEFLSFKNWQSRPSDTLIPLATAQSNVNTVNTWATIALVSGIAGVAGLTAAGLTW